MADITKKYMSWEKFDNDVEEFIAYIKDHNFDNNSVILALKRGGFATATALSNKMGIPVSTVAYQTRDGNDSQPNFLEPELIRNASKIIIPDDIYDTGVTIENTVSVLINNFNVSIDNIIGLFHFGSEKLETTQLKRYRVMDSNENLWCVFPWE
jgi:hypoxanthine phosphoribosyltransferase